MQWQAFWQERPLMDQHVCWITIFLPLTLDRTWPAFYFLALDQRSPHLTSGLSVISDSQLPPSNWFWLFCTICSPPGSRRALPFVPTSCCHLCSLSLGVLKSTAPNNGLSPLSCLVCWLWLNANNDYYECPFSEMLIMLLYSSPYLAFENPVRRTSFIPSLWRAGNWGLAKLNVICLNSHQSLGPVIFPPNLFPMLPFY